MNGHGQRTANSENENTKGKFCLLIRSLPPKRFLAGNRTQSREKSVTLMILIPKPTDLKQGSKVRGIVHIVGIVGAEQQHQ